MGIRPSCLVYYRVLRPVFGLFNFVYQLLKRLRFALHLPKHDFGAQRTCLCPCFVTEPHQELPERLKLVRVLDSE